ncbi:prephenate-dependent tRNA uridine(34) hydroxylase TrhP [Pseudomonas neustonica]|uniref:prephenate-dependent tRNA uridine(34) hydroxylase TrhP n=1 Tax=Pseudomonas TaxID=286 RepID=UPI000C91C708|nr:tRNA 5-hydroxyuridine modification protein YegQ [Pseudomonas sp. 5Ae-yellow]MAB25509.1 U32 family peptidase [Pseudomonadales bacterium]MBA6421444.1 tRNA 5-hydroxyuridine modification protein YegQ [Pseudomonas sp. 5Ae-yellow]|tara:strand:+ start:8170 stop:9453 length:1284 start_codon:yes stop_codon:yes gene_type:complete
MPTFPELLAPAGTLKAMRYAFAYGADAVYAGQPRYSLRVRENDFHDPKVLAEAITEAHAQGKKFYLASNIAAHNSKVATYLRDLESVVAMGPDALIMSDPGLIMLVRERWPELPVHLSVQANAVNWATVTFWQKLGLERIILSRELSLDEVEEIRRRCPDVGLEVFVHGALCIAYSGRCLLSGYFNHRDANQGACTNACRWQYDVKPGVETPEGNIEPVSKPVQIITQRNKPDEPMAIEEDEHGTYVMNSKDLRAVQHVERFVRMGVDSLKIEGRTKSHFYVARTVQAYRQAIDDAVAGRPFNLALMDDLESLANRGYTEGFYRRHPPGVYQNYEQGASRMTRHQFVGELAEADNDWITIAVKNRFSLGDRLELMTPTGNQAFILQAMQDRRGQPIDVAPGDGHLVRIPRPAIDNLDFALLLRYLPD